LTLDLTSEEQRLLSQIRRRKAELLSEITQLQDEIEQVTREMTTNSTNSDANSVTSSGGKVPAPLAEGERDNESVGSGSGGGQQQSRVNATKNMSLGCKKFNMDPKKGIEFLVHNELLVMEAVQVAQVGGLTDCEIFRRELWEFIF
jgi:hypothetical protein